MIEKIVEIEAGNKTANLAIVKKFDEEQDIYIFDIYESITNGEDEERTILGIDRYILVADAPFTLTADEIAILKGEVEPTPL